MLNRRMPCSKVSGRRTCICVVRTCKMWGFSHIRQLNFLCNGSLRNQHLGLSSCAFLCLGPSPVPRSQRGRAGRSRSPGDFSVELVGLESVTGLVSWRGESHVHGVAHCCLELRAFCNDPPGKRSGSAPPRPGARFVLPIFGKGGKRESKGSLAREAKCFGHFQAGSQVLLVWFHPCTPGSHVQLTFIQGCPPQRPGASLGTQTGRAGPN